MKNLIPILALVALFSASSCKKKIEDKKQDIIMTAITDGTWIVEQYFEETTNISSDFVDYDFKFNTDGSVTGTKQGVTTNGTWAGDASNYSISSNFPSAVAPLQKMNGVWKITDSYLDYVEAEMTTSAGKNILHLRKKV
ncbi:MAG: hypothetical protein H7Y31_05400 [Chitinophagaceae bacterium]|nr:hypothetical protein [Chitinophagaceae bacterium]